MIDPLVPPDVDLRGYEFMPLYGHHLFGSDFNARVSDAAWRAAVTLWWAAWNQVPAASLPNDDVALTRLADLGRDVRSFKKIKADALHGFIECADGRLYHKALATWALEAWDRRVKERNRKAQWRAGKLRDSRRDGTGTDDGTEQGQETGHRRDVPAEGKRSEAKGSDVENRDSGVMAPTVPPVETVNGKIAMGKIARPKSKAGQNWDDPTYVRATAEALGVERRSNEADGEFRDRVFTAVQTKIRDAAGSLGRRAQ